MADSKSRKTGEQNALLLKLVAEAAAMREHIAALEERVLSLEAELASLKDGKRASKRPPRPLGPPPLPRISTSMNAVKAGASRSFVDISDIAELVESIPPPGPRSKK